MRVHYTIPGLAPLPDPAPAPHAPEKASFQSRLRRLSVSLPRNWRDLLRLNVPPAAATLIGPPPRPPTLETGDAARERIRWRIMLDAHTRALQGSQQDAAGELRSVERMLALLNEYRRLEDAVVARHISETSW
jgi:hypothetical protein